MKLFPSDHRIFKQFAIVCFLILLAGCATHEAQYGRNAAKDFAVSEPSSKLEHTFFLVGDAGNSDKQNSKTILGFLKNKLNVAKPESTLLFLGDNIYPSGMPATDDKFYKAASEKMDNQINLAKEFKGKTVFIPGNHDWYQQGLSGLKRQQEYVTSKLGKKSFLPKNGCGIDDVKINDNITMIILDSQWYIENWNDHPEINADCDIKDREVFFDELEDLLNKNQNKTVILAVHHPLISNGSHGGQYSLMKNLFPFQSDLPLPVVGSAINFVRKTSGVVDQDLQNKKYVAFTKRVKTLIVEHPNVIVVSGHEHSLQYLEKDGVRQVVSGAGSKLEAARAILPNDFSFGGNGYAVLNMYEKGESWLSFYGLKGKKEMLLHKFQLTPPVLEKEIKVYPNTFPKTESVSIYHDSLTKKSGFYNFLWGKHYRYYYSKKLQVASVNLDTLYGGLKPVIAGGGHQSMSLRLEDKSGKQYVMRGLKKSAVRFIQSVAFKNQSVGNDFRNTYAEDFLLDFYTTSHPYTPFIVGDLAESVEISHSNPKLFYVPKQNAIAEYDEEYGDQLYMIEERPADGFEKLPSFGKPDKIVGTDDVLQNIVKDEKYKVDEQSYIRARLFDMLIGDWDRHYDQWRWGEYKNKGKVTYKPIPRDRDQAFSKYDGTLLWIILNMPALRHMQSFKEDIRNVKWFNMEAYPLDLAFIRDADLKLWKEQAEYIRKNMSDTEIDRAFAKLPKEVQDPTSEDIKRKLKIRREKLLKYAERYYEVLQKTVLIVGTEKKNRFEINRSKNGETEVKVYSIKDDRESLISGRIYNCKETRELWIYGLDDQDVFEVNGKGSHPIKLRLIGGLENDTYKIKNGRKVRIYDFKSQENTIESAFGTTVRLSDKYELNQYDYKKPKYNAMGGLPNIGFNPDDGVKVGISMTYTVNGFKRNPFSQRHNVRGNYYFATEGYEVLYRGIFPNSLSKWQFQLDGQITSPNFSFNFFGYGNETKNNEDDLGMNYNRVKAQTIKATPSYNWKGDMGAFFTIEGDFESIEVDRSHDRIIDVPGMVDQRVFRTQNFTALNVRYGYENYDNVSNPTLGMKFSVEVGYQMNLRDTDRRVPHAEAILGFSHKILSEGKLVFATLMKSKFLFSNDYEFYQMASIGGDYDVRAFRSERFSGKRSYFQSSDLRYELGKIKSSIIPMRYGFLGGFDYGRVWLPEESSDKWHTSYGGGFWLNGINVVTAKLSYFQSSEGGRVSFGLGFGF